MRPSAGSDVGGSASDVGGPGVPRATRCPRPAVPAAYTAPPADQGLCLSFHAVQLSIVVYTPLCVRSCVMACCLRPRRAVPQVRSAASPRGALE